MAKHSVSHRRNSQKKQKSPEAPERLITQADLEELIYLRRLFDEAHEKWMGKYEVIRQAVVAGAKTESGVHTVALVHLGKWPRLLVR